MSQVAIRNALETALAAMTPALSTAYENQSFTPTAPTVAYQEAYVLFATPDNQVFGSEHMELGYLQVTLKYPLGAGPSAAATRAELLKTTFARGQSFVSGGITTVISRTAEVMPGFSDGARWVVVVKIRFFAHII